MGRALFALFNVGFMFGHVLPWRPSLQFVSGAIIFIVKSSLDTEEAILRHVRLLTSTVIQNVKSEIVGATNFELIVVFRHFGTRKNLHVFIGGEIRMFLSK